MACFVKAELATLRSLPTASIDNVVQTRCADGELLVALFSLPDLSSDCDRGWKIDLFSVMAESLDDSILIPSDLPKV